MLQVYLVRYDCLKIQQLIPNRYFCILFYVFCILDLVLLLFSCSFFLIPYQQQEFEQQYILNKDSDQWSKGASRKRFKELDFRCTFSFSSASLHPQFLQMSNQSVDPYYNYGNETTLFLIEDLSSLFGRLSQRQLHMTQPTCLQILFNEQSHHFHPILGMPKCSLSRNDQVEEQEHTGVRMVPWFQTRHRADILFEMASQEHAPLNFYYLAEACFQVSVSDQRVVFSGGCFAKDGLVYKKLKPGQSYNFKDTKIYLRNVDDPYIAGVQFSQDYAHPEKLKETAFPKFIEYCFVLGCGLVVQLIFVLLTLKLLKNNHNLEEFEEEQRQQD